LTVSVNAAPPADALSGDNEVIVGVGAWRLKSYVEDKTFPGLITCAVHVPGSVPKVTLLT
jgi:hypothetical protein